MADIINFKKRRKKKTPGDNDAQRPPPAAREIDVEKCPIKPLGEWKGVYFYLSRSGEMRDMPYNQHTYLGIGSLFGGESEWLNENFSKFTKEGVPTGEFNVGKAAYWLMKQCAKRGHFDPQTIVRGPGVWQDENKRVLVHCGNKIRIDGVWGPAGIVKNDVLYPASPRIARPAAKPCSSDQARALLTAARCWEFEAEGGADLFVGWIGSAMLGGAPIWRAHMFATGERGCGKSWLADLASAALGGAGHPPLNNFTEAYIRQALTSQSRAFILDESEDDDVRGRIKAVIELIRHMSGGVGARVGRGSSGGQATTFPITGCAYLSAVLHGQLKPQDKSRIMMLTLKQLPAGVDQTGRSDRALAEIAKIRDLSPRLWARALDGWPRFQDTFGAYRAGFMSLGCDARQSDQAATIVAGRDLLIENAAPDHDSVREIIAKFSYLVDAAAEDDDESEGKECLNQLYTAQAGMWKGGDRRTVSQVIMEAMHAGGINERESLGTIGLRIERQRQPGKAVLLVATAHVGLGRIFEGTRWYNRGWTEALRYLEGVYRWPNPVRFAGVLSRATALPWGWLPREETAEQPTAEDDL